MPSLNISLPEELKKYVEAQIHGGQYGNVSEYFRSLIRDHQKQSTQERFERLLLEGIESGSAGAMTDSDWESLRQSAFARAKVKGKSVVRRKSKRT